MNVWQTVKNNTKELSPLFLCRWQFQDTRLGAHFQEAFFGVDEILTALVGERLVDNMIALDIGYAVVCKPVPNTKGR